MAPTATPQRPFGRVLTAMVTPFDAAGGLDLDAAQRLATHLVDHGNDGLIISGTTGESPTTSDAEKDALLRAVVEAVGDRAHVVAGVGTNDTAHSVALAKGAEKAGAHAALVVTPYYSRPPQSGLLAHFRAVADASQLPVMVYDIPVRSGVPIETETLCSLAEHPRIVAVKDAKADLQASSQVLARTDLAYYCGDDALTLPFLSIGAVGVVGVATHLTSPLMAQLIAAFERGDHTRAREIHEQLIPAFIGFFRTQGVITTKAALGLVGLPGAGPVRPPLVDATPDQLDQLKADLAAAGLLA